jgi:ATP-dependent DNA ligase
MRYAFSLPTKAYKVPAHPDWRHEIKYDGQGADFNLASVS